MIFKSYLIEQNFQSINTNLILFFGENIGLKNEFKKKIKSNNLQAETITFFQDDIIRNEDNFFSELFNISLFEKKKIYIIDNATDKILNILQKIEPKLENQKIFLFSDLLDKKSMLRNYFEKSKNASAIACYADNEITIKKIILKNLKEFRGLSSQNINIIIDNSNLERDKLYNELDKIITFFTNKEIVTETLEVLLNAKTNDNFNLLKDEAINGNKNKTNKLLSETIIEPEKNILYLNIINQRFNKISDVLKLVQSTNLENAINMTKPPIFWKDKATVIEQTKKWNKNKIKNILNKTYSVELEIKSNSVINKNILLKKLLVDICTMANAS
jgi:DNA polymerase III subunit delta